MTSVSLRTTHLNENKSIKQTEICPSYKTKAMFELPV